MFYLDSKVSKVPASGSLGEVLREETV